MVKMKRKPIGRRGDLILRKGTAEYGCMEAGARDEGQWGTKKLLEKGIKAPKILKDIFNYLCHVINNEESSVRQLRTIGYIQSGTSLMLIYLWEQNCFLTNIPDRLVHVVNDYGFFKGILLQNRQIQSVLNSR
jgi:hypothetical protein